MTARAAETHRSACPAAATQRLRFPRDHNEQVAVLRAHGKSLARGKPVPGTLAPGVAACLLTSVPPRGWMGSQLNSLPLAGETGGQFGTGDLFLKS